MRETEKKTSFHTSNMSLPNSSFIIGEGAHDQNVEINGEEEKELQDLSSSDEDDIKKEKKTKKGFLSKTVEGIAKGTMVVGKGIAKGTKAVGHGMVKGSKAVGHALSKENKEGKDKKEKSKEIENGSDNEIVISEPVQDKSNDTSSIDSHKKNKIRIRLTKSVTSIPNEETPRTPKERKTLAQNELIGTSSSSKTDKESKKESKSRRFGKKRNCSNGEDPLLSLGSQGSNEGISATDKSEKSFTSKDSNKKTPEKEENEKRGVFASAGKFVKGLGETTKEALSFSNSNTAEKSAEEKAKEQQENLLILQLFKQNVVCFNSTSPFIIPCESLVGYKRMNKSKITKKDLVFAMCCNAVYSGAVKIDCWSSLEMPKDMYLDGDFGESLVHLDVKKDGYYIETCYESITHNTDLKDFIIVDFEAEFPFYKEFFYNNDQVKHYLSKEENVICSIQKFKEVSRCILRNSNGVFRCLIGKEESEKPSSYDKFFKDPKSVVCVNNTKDIDEELLELETNRMVSSYKFGVIYVKPNQIDENAIFNNNPDDCSPAFWKFLDLIGSKIELNGWKGYRGGLDVKNGTTGVYSYVSHSHNFEIMFHAAPLLPLLKNDEQALERKRHVGNDIAVLIFKEQSDKNDTFDPRILNSHFNSVYLVVTPETTSETNTKYRVSCCTKPSIDSFPPFLNENGVYEHCDSFREFVLRKLINGERTAMFSPTFEKNSGKIIRGQLKTLNERYYK